MEVVNHRLVRVLQRESPNCDERPMQARLSLIVIHCISLPPGHFAGEDVDALFTNCLDPKAHPYFHEIYRLKVSTHVFIRRSGKIIQYVPFNKRAWHAGRSCYAGVTACNDFSIGIELEGTDKEGYEEEQYDCLAALINALLESYPDLSADRVIGHSDIAPGRKTDPGEFFNWKRLFENLNGLRR